MTQVHQLEPLTEYDPDLLNYRNLGLVIDYICREGDRVVSGRPIRDPCDLVHRLREMKCRTSSTTSGHPSSRGPSTTSFDPQRAAAHS